MLTQFYGIRAQLQHIMEWPPHITVAAIAERDGKFLFVTEYIGGQLLLNQPAGHLDPGETLFDAVKRETLEETGWRVEPSLVTGIYHYPSHHAGVVYHRITFLVTLLELTDMPIDPAIDSVHWLSPAEMGAYTPRSPIVTRCLADYRQRGGFPLDLIAHLQPQRAR